jgi:Ser/Thr protein kinase RdoA (MazF antagonist)
VIEPFKPDLFSVAGPRWVPVDRALANKVHGVLEQCGDPALALSALPEQSQGLEINSNNLRITTSAGRFLLKRWSSGADASATERTLEVMEFLGAKALPVPVPLRLNGGLQVEHEGRRWSLFPFIEGRWFTGDSREAEAAADISGRVSLALGELPPRLRPRAGPAHLTDGDDEVLARMEGERERWDHMLGSEYAALLASCWSDVMQEWRRLRRDPPHAGPIQAAHFDLHPHNLLLDGNRVAAVLDFEACGMMPLGYAIAFAGLKQGRQAVVAQRDVRCAPRVGAAFLGRITAVCPLLADVRRYADLALGETLRRLAIIFRLNVEQSVATWNKVLPIQLAHLSESRLLFNP